MSLQGMMNPKPSPPDAQKFDDVLKEQKVPLRSWRKKYRKMKLQFDKAMNESNQLYKECKKLEIAAKRLQEENDQFMETLLHLNETGRIPSYDLGDPHQDVVPVPGEDAVPPLDPSQPRSLATLLSIPHTEPGHDTAHYPPEMVGSSPPGFLSTEYEEEYLNNLDAQLALPESHDEHWRPTRLPPSRVLPSEKELLNANPMSVLSWLRRYHPETFIQEKEAAGEKMGRPRGGGGKRSSMATVTSAATPVPKVEPDEMEEEEWAPEEKASTRAKKTKDDDAYRPKGGASRGSKRKRDDGEKTGGRKRAKAAPASTPG